MKKDLLLIIDMQNVYGSGGEWHCPGVDQAAVNIRRILPLAEGKMEVIFTRFLAEESPAGTWKDYNRVNAEVNGDAYANDIMEIFHRDLERYPVYTKSVYSSLQIPQVREAVKGADRIVLTGVVAECCVLATAMAAIDAGAYVIYLTDAVAGISKETEAATETVLAGLEPVQVKRMTTDEWIHEMREVERGSNYGRNI